MQTSQYVSETDLKGRFGGILEQPYISKIHRHCLDGFKVTGLRKILQSFQFENILDVGCGLGEYSHLNKGRYIGIDNSFPRIAFAQKQYKQSYFITADAVQLPFRDNSFEAVLLANTAHHLSEEALLTGMNEMKRISRRYIIIDDCVKSDDQSRLSRFFYRLDRGTMFRTIEQFKEFFNRYEGVSLIKEGTHRTFPGLYLHAVFVLEKKEFNFQ